MRPRAIKAHCGIRQDKGGFIEGLEFNRFGTIDLQLGVRSQAPGFDRMARQYLCGFADQFPCCGSIDAHGKCGQQAVSRKR
ncbi:hypothetical protein AB4071_11005 [Stenotrophomonas sp. 2MCAF14_2]|uniref:hypothetical protein n=1 Tax=Stenotrophomonas sp. 2MCAF14_2 TaxID=3232983 RepID=UPI003F9C6953